MSGDFSTSSSTCKLASSSGADSGLSFSDEAEEQGLMSACGAYGEVVRGGTERFLCSG